MSPIPASIASKIASGANAAGVKIPETLAPRLSTASMTRLYTGIPSRSVPPLPGVTPATTLVPIFTDSRVWKLPSEPVIP